jgi:phage tail-like protein
MATGHGEPLLRIDSFEVLIGDRELGFAEVSRLSSEADLEAIDASRNRFATVVLRRAITTSSELFDWRRAIVAGKDDRRDVTIRQLSAPGGKAVNAWRLVGARPVRWSGPAFDALHADIAFEEIELAFDDLVWLAPRSRNRGG